MTSPKDNKINIDKTKLVELSDLLADFLNREVQKINKPDELAIRMARIARGIRDNLIKLNDEGQEPEGVHDIRNSLSYIMPEIMDDDNKKEFIDMYAQTIIYGLFIARCNHNGTEPFRRTSAVEDIPKTNPFIKKLFENIMGNAMLYEPYNYLVEDMVTILSNTDVNRIMENFGLQEGRPNPFIYFMKRFLMNTTEIQDSIKAYLSLLNQLYHISYSQSIHY